MFPKPSSVTPAKNGCTMDDSEHYPPFQLHNIEPFSLSHDDRVTPCGNWVRRPWCGETMREKCRRSCRQGNCDLHFPGTWHYEL
eukprot:scaffold7059_cov250-Pinguiococcus_pyrenoidosus.AAC.21